MLMSLNSSPYSSAWRVVLGEAVLSAPEDTIPLVNLFLCCLDTDTAQLGPGQGPPWSQPTPGTERLLQGARRAEGGPSRHCPQVGRGSQLASQCGNRGGQGLGRLTASSGLNHGMERSHM